MAAFALMFAAAIWIARQGLDAMAVLVFGLAVQI
jgi:hypothetical protein